MAEPTTDSFAQLREALAGRYDIQTELGRGGMATVYLAEDLKHGRRVAVKVLRPELAASVGVERFLREIHIAAQLQHPHILMLIDSGDAGGQLYFVMPYVEGESLRDRLEREGPLPLSDSVRLARETAEGLAYAHARGVVHRDIKPENIMISGGHALIMDFGISRAIGELGGERLTETGLAIGTPAYMSPEQWSTATRADGRSDIYSLGCVLYEMLVGEPPFRANTVSALLARHSMEAVPSVRIVRPTVPEHIEAVILIAMAKVPADRFANATQFAQALGTDADSTTGLPATSPRRIPSPRPGRRRPALLLAGGLVLAGALAGSLLLLPGWGAAADPDRVVVSGLQDLARDPALDDLGRMAADWITTGLQRTNFPVVPSPTAVQAAQYVRAQVARDGRDPLRALAEETGARYVVTVGITPLGDTLQFVAQLADARARSPVQIGEVNPIRVPASAPVEAIEQLRERVLGLMAIHLDDRLANAAGTVGQPPTIESYRAFSDGMERYVRNEFRAALTSFYDAFERDSSAVIALLYAALCHNNLNEWAQADSISRVVAGMSDLLTSYHRAWLDYVRAQVEGRREQAWLAIQRAVEMDPQSKAAYNLAWVALQTNRPRQAYDALRALDPDRGPMRGWLPFWSVLTDALHRLGRHDDELAAARRARERFPDQLGAIALEIDALAALGRIQPLEQLFDTAAARAGPDIAIGIMLHSAALELRAHDHGPASERIFDRADKWFNARPQELRETEEHRSWYAAVLSDWYRWPDARRLVDALAAQYPENHRYLGWRGSLAARQGHTQTADSASRALSALDRPYLFGSHTLGRARIAAVLNRREEAVTLLREAFSQGHTHRRHIDRNFEPLRGYPPFEQLIRPRD